MYIEAFTGALIIIMYIMLNCFFFFLSCIYWMQYICWTYKVPTIISRMCIYWNDIIRHPVWETFSSIFVRCNDFSLLFAIRMPKIYLFLTLNWTSNPIKKLGVSLVSFFSIAVCFRFPYTRFTKDEVGKILQFCGL